MHNYCFICTDCYLCGKDCMGQYYDEICRQCKYKDAIFSVKGIHIIYMKIRIKRWYLISIGIPIIKIKCSHDHNIFIMKIPTPGKTSSVCKRDPAHYCTHYRWVNPLMTGSIFSKYDFIFWCCSFYVQYFYMKLVQYNECLVSIVDTDSLVL